MYRWVPSPEDQTGWRLETITEPVDTWLAPIYHAGKTEPGPGDQGCPDDNKE